MMEENNIPFGIDLGCTKTCGAVWRNEKIEVILNELDSKQILAQKATDPLIKKFKTQWTFDLKGNRAKGNICEYIVNEQTEPLSPIVVSGEILKSIKKSAEKQCSQKLTKAVITVPAYFSTEQKKATQEAAKYANLDVISIITEPTAAAIAYGLEQHKYKDGEKLFVFDLGGGTFDVTIMSISKNCFTNLVVRGDFNLGGRDFDHLIFEWIKQKLAAEGMDVKNLNQKKKFKMMLQAQAVKEALTFSQEKLVILSDIFETAKSHMLKRSEFEAMSKTLLKKLETECQAALQSKNLKPRDIDHVLFVGGSSRMPMVAKMLKNIFLDETKFAKVVNPDEVVAVGAAMYAAACLKASKRPEIVGMNIVLVLPMNIGVEILASESAENLERFKLYPTRPAIGIHLGTTNSCVGYFVNNNVEIVTSPSGKRTVPSYVFYDENEGCIIGEQAIARLKTNPNHVVYGNFSKFRNIFKNDEILDSKRMIGLNYDDNVVNRNKSFWTFTVTKDDNNRPIYDIDKKHQALPEEVSSEILKELVKMVQDKTWIKKINAAVITVPDHFLVGQKEATIHAAKLAGIENVVLITEPTAVAFAYGFDHKRFDGYNLFIFRLGGKTCDVSIVKVEKGEFKVIGHAGDTQLGGRDFDSCLVHYFDEKYRELCVFHGDNEIITKRRIRLREACENFKIAVSLPGKHSETIHFNDISPDLSAEDLTYKEYKEIVADITRRCRKLCFDTLEETQLTADDIDEILLAGGSTKMRVIKDMLKGIFQKRELSEAISPDEVFAYGATLRAAQFLDPEKSKTFCNSLTLPNGIGVSLVGNRIHNLFKRNTPFSTKFGPETYSTVYNNQTVMNFYIYQGERLSTDKNDFIMDVELEGLPKKRAEEVKATLELELDAHGSLTAVARGGGKEVTKQVNYKEQIMQKGNNLCNAPSNSSNIKLCASVDEKNVNLEKFLNRHYGHVFLF
uniref:Heat shock protein 70 n=1 Tax=Panagrolaimus davidi TaxID=227884 RepID=A0A914P6G0_9BILA